MIKLKPGMVVEMEDNEKFLVGIFSSGTDCYDVKKFVSISLKDFIINDEFSIELFLNKYKIKKIYKDITCKEVILEIKESLLDDEEKKYLSAIIRPIKDRVINIEKTKVSRGKKEYCYLSIGVKSIIPKNISEYILLPCFKKDTMYKKLEYDTKYTLEDLGLKED